MKPNQLALLGLVLMLIGFIIPRVVPSVAAGLHVVFTLCYVVGLLTLIIGGIRQNSKKKNGK